MRGPLSAWGPTHKTHVSGEDRDSEAEKLAGDQVRFKKEVSLLKSHRVLHRKSV